ncbi:MAG: pilus assembly protein PilM, partial [Zoogloeaceae bacterium]|nr:pilus assembly protein PilM [Zoogloeaceae bacterium]
QRIYSREQAFGGDHLTQDIARQYGMSLDEAETAKRTNGLPGEYAANLLQPFMDSLALEVSRALQFFFTSTQYNEVNVLMLAGGGVIMPGLTEIVSGRTQVQTLLANPFMGMAPPRKHGANKLMADAPSLMVACGLALRRFDA